MMNPLFRALIPLGILAGGIGGMWALGSREQPTQEPRADADPPALMTVPVEVHEGDWELEIDGLVRPFREIEVSAEVAGRSRWRSEDCHAGHYVRRGAALVEIDPADYRLEVDRSEKLLEQARVELEEHDVEFANTRRLLELAQRNLQLERREQERFSELSRRQAASQSELERTERAAIASEQTVQDLQNRLQSMRVRRARLLSGVELAASQRERARLDLERTRIAAPVDGVIVQNLVEQEGYVQKGQSLFRIEDTSRIEVQSSLRMDQLYWLWSQESPPSDASLASDQAYRIPATRATVISQIAGLPERRFTWQGELARFDGIGLDERTRTVPCRIVVDQPRQVSVVNLAGEPVASPASPPALVRGMYVTVRLHVLPQAELLLIPENALLPDKRVWCVRDDRLIPLGPLVLIRRLERSTSDGLRKAYWLAPSVENGLLPGDQLVFHPVRDLEEGRPVQAVMRPDAPTLERLGN